jgi:beta-phosphoglucomutase
VLANSFSRKDLQAREGVTATALQAVIFDCDGILVDTEPLHYRAFQEVLRPLGLGFDYDRYLDRYIGFDDRDAFAEAFKEAGRVLDGGTLEELIHRKEKALQAIIDSGAVSSFPGVTELVTELAAGAVPLAVASGALRSEVQAFVTVLGLSGAFSVVVAADDVASSKPDPETYLKALDGLQRGSGNAVMRPQQCVAIEDTPAGIQAARTAGIRVVGVTNSFPAEQLTAAHLVVTSLNELSLARLVQLVQEKSSEPHQ